MEFLTTLQKTLMKRGFRCIINRATNDLLDALRSVPSFDFFDICSSLLDFNRSLEVQNCCGTCCDYLVDIDFIQRIRPNNDSWICNLRYEKTLQKVSISFIKNTVYNIWLIIIILLICASLSISTFVAIWILKNDLSFRVSLDDGLASSSWLIAIIDGS